MTGATKPPSPAAGNRDAGIAPLQHGVQRLASGRNLTPAHRRTFAYLVEFAADVPFLSAQELARKVGVSQPSVSRLASALGFDGYGALRRELQELFRQHVSQAASSTESDGPVPFKYGWAAARESTNAAHAAQIWYEASLPLTDIAAQMMLSRPLVVLGLRASAHLATYAGYLADKIHPNVVTITHGGDTLMDDVTKARMNGATWMIAAVMPRYPTEALQAVAHAQATGLQILLLTDAGYVHHGDSSGLALVRVPVEHSLVFDSHAAPQLILTMLLEAMCDTNPMEIERRLDALDATAEDHGIYQRQ